MKKSSHFLRNIIVVILSAVVVLLLVLYQPDKEIEALKNQYAVPPSQFMELDGMQVHYRDQGPQNDSLPLVLLHGTASSLFTWEACTNVWKEKHRVLRMDMPAFGLTGPNSEDDYRIATYVGFVHAFLQKLGVTKCVIIGNSLGGLIAAAYTVEYPDAVEKLILIDPAGYPIENAKGSLGFTLGRIPVIKNLLTIITPKSMVRKSMEDVYGNPALVTDSLVEQYRDMTLRKGNRDALVVRLNMQQDWDTLQVKKIQAPTMIIWGQKDNLIPVSNAYKFQRDLKHPHLEILPESGHVPMEETPQKVIALVERFVQSEHQY